MAGMTITVRIDTAATGQSDLVETLRMAIGLALGDAALHVVFTDGGRAWWNDVRTRDEAVRGRLDDLLEAVNGIGATVAGLTGEGGDVEYMATSDLVINSVGPRAA